MQALGVVEMVGNAKWDNHLCGAALRGSLLHWSSGKTEAAVLLGLSGIFTVVMVPVYLASWRILLPFQGDVQH